jgi:hypothetical protein
MRAQANRLEDKKYLKKLALAADISESRIKLDECGDWNIKGIRGHIFTDGDYWYVYINQVGTRKWTSIRNLFYFMEITQDGDDEGVLRCNRMPSRDEAREVRKVIGVRPRTMLTEEQRAVLKNRFKSSSQRGVSSAGIDLNDKRVPG